MSDEPSTTGDSWCSHLPWLILFRCFRPAVGVRMLVLGAGGIVANVAGWRILWQMFGGSTDPAIQKLSAAVGSDGIWPLWPWNQGIGESPLSFIRGSSWIPSEISRFVEQLCQPLFIMFDADAGFVGFTFGLICILWALVVWSYFGGAMTRTASLRLCRDEMTSWSEVAGFSISKFPSYLAAPLFPMLGILLAMIPIVVLGWIANVPTVGLVFSGLVFPVALLCGLFMTIIGIGFLFGWPFMWTTVSTEGTDAFDALSRSYAYVYQRPLRYLGYAVVAAVLGILGYCVVSLFVSGVPAFALWAADWGMSDDKIQPIREYLQANHSERASLELSTGASLFVFWVSCVKLFGTGYLASYFWTAMTAIYLLLRRDIDATEMDEVFLTDEEETYGLPPLATDETGVPGVPDEANDSGSDVE